MASVHTDKRILALSDVHLPYSSARALSLAEKFKKDFKPNITLALGDWLDVSAASSFSRDVEDFDALHEIELCNELLDRFKPTHFFEGNHEYRLRKAGNIPQEIRRLMDLKQWLNLKKRGIKWQPYENDKPLQIGNLTFIHGFAHGLNSGRKSIKEFGNIVYGHTHRVAMESDVVPGTIGYSYNIGCLCDIRKMEYIKQKGRFPWTNGFGYGTVKKSGSFQFNVVPIHAGRKEIRIDGKTYKL